MMAAGRNADALVLADSVSDAYGMSPSDYRKVAGK